MKWLEGKKTNIAAGGAIVLGIAGGFFGVLDFAEATTLIVFGLGFFGLRDAIGRAIAEKIAQRAIDEGKKRRSATTDERR